MPDARPLLSVVVPVRDNHALTRSCLESAKRTCDGSQAEVLVVDDGSKVLVSEALANAGLELRILRHAKSFGFAAAANTGLAAARGDLLLLLNNDTELEPDAVGRLVRAFDRDPKLGIAGAELFYPDGTPQWSGGRKPGFLWCLAQASGLPRGLGKIPGYRRLRPVHRSPSGIDWVAGAAMVMRRAVWHEVGPLDETLGTYAQDLDFCLRATQAGWKVEVVPGARILHHHGATMTQEASATGASRRHPGHLWSSLLAWSHKAGGRSQLARTRRALLLGGRIRMVFSKLQAPFRSPSAREELRRVRASCRLGLEMVRRFEPPAPEAVARAPRHPIHGDDRHEFANAIRAVEDRRRVEVVRSLP